MPAPLTAAAGRIFSLPDSGTYLLDGIIEVSQGIKKRNFSQAGDRRDHHRGPGDERPPVSERPRTAARFRRGLPRHRRRQSAQHRRTTARSCSTRARGRAVDASTRCSTGNALTARMKQVAAELTHQFRVTYARPQTLIPPEQVTVVVGEGRTDGARHAGARDASRRIAGNEAAAGRSSPACASRSGWFRCPGRISRRRRQRRRRPPHRSRQPPHRRHPRPAPPATRRRPRHSRRAPNAGVPRRRRAGVAERHRYRRRRRITSPISRMPISRSTKTA